MVFEKEERDKNATQGRLNSLRIWKSLFIESKHKQT